VDPLGLVQKKGNATRINDVWAISRVSHHFARNRMINFELKEAIAIRPYFAQMRQLSRHRGSSGRGNQGDTANIPSS
jgi:hypothetical protein